MSGVRIRCDAPGCEVLYPPAPVHGGYKALKQRATIRQDAAEAGWAVCDAGQFCPEHSDRCWNCDERGHPGHHWLEQPGVFQGYVCFGKDSAN